MQTSQEERTSQSLDDSRSSHAISRESTSDERDWTTLQNGAKVLFPNPKWKLTNPGEILSLDNSNHTAIAMKHDDFPDHPFHFLHEDTSRNFETIEDYNLRKASRGEMRRTKCNVGPFTDLIHSFEEVYLNGGYHVLNNTLVVAYRAAGIYAIQITSDNRTQQPLTRLLFEIARACEIEADCFGTFFSEVTYRSAKASASVTVPGYWKLFQDNQISNHGRRLLQETTFAPLFNVVYSFNTCSETSIEIVSAMVSKDNSKGYDLAMKVANLLNGDCLEEDGSTSIEGWSIPQFSPVKTDGDHSGVFIIRAKRTSGMYSITYVLGNYCLDCQSVGNTGFTFYPRTLPPSLAKAILTAMKTASMADDIRVKEPNIGIGFRGASPTGLVSVITTEVPVLSYFFDAAIPDSFFSICRSNRTMCHDRDGKLVGYPQTIEEWNRRIQEFEPTKVTNKKISSFHGYPTLCYLTTERAMDAQDNLLTTSKKVFCQIIKAESDTIEIKMHSSGQSYKGDLSKFEALRNSLDFNVRRVGLFNRAILADLEQPFEKQGNTSQTEPAPQPGQ